MLRGTPLKENNLSCRGLSIVLTITTHFRNGHRLFLISALTVRRGRRSAIFLSSVADGYRPSFFDISDQVEIPPLISQPLRNTLVSINFLRRFLRIANYIQNEGWGCVRKGKARLGWNFSNVANNVSKRWRISPFPESTLTPLEVLFLFWGKRGYFLKKLMMYDASCCLFPASQTGLIFVFEVIELSDYENLNGFHNLW